jgi:hypothetical protein
VYICANGTGGSGHTWTTTYSTSSNRSISAFEIKSVGAFDTPSKTTVVDSTTPYSITSNTLSNNSSIVFVTQVGDTAVGTHQFTLPTGWVTLIRDNGTPTMMGIIVGTKLVTSTAAVSINITGTSSLETALAIFAFNNPITSTSFILMGQACLV